MPHAELQYQGLRQKLKRSPKAVSHCYDSQLSFWNCLLCLFTIVAIQKVQSARKRRLLISQIYHYCPQNTLLMPCRASFGIIHIICITDMTVLTCLTQSPACRHTDPSSVQLLLHTCAWSCIDLTNSLPSEACISKLSLCGLKSTLCTFKCKPAWEWVCDECVGCWWVDWLLSLFQMVSPLGLERWEFPSPIHSLCITCTKGGIIRFNTGNVIMIWKLIQ